MLIYVAQVYIPRGGHCFTVGDIPPLKDEAGDADVDRKFRRKRETERQPVVMRFGVLKGRFSPLLPIRCAVSISFCHVVGSVLWCSAFTAPVSAPVTRAIRCMRVPASGLYHGGAVEQW